MTLNTIISLSVIVFFLPGFAVAGGVTEKDFVADTTQDLIDLCMVSPDDPLYDQAIGFCHGYLVGAWDYYEAQSSGPKGIKFVCPPSPMPSRNDAISMFIEWAKAHPQHMGETPVESEFRFLTEKWSCKP